MRIRVVRLCAQCRVHWLDGEPPRCADPGHEHRGLELHLHESDVVLPDGTAITAVSYDADDPYARDQTPDYGLYLDRRWQPPWPHEYVDWPDFGVPRIRSGSWQLCGPSSDALVPDNEWKWGAWVGMAGREPLWPASQHCPVIRPPTQSSGCGLHTAPRRSKPTRR